MKTKSRLILLVLALGVGCKYSACAYKPTPSSVICWPMVPQIDAKGNYIPLFQMNLSDTPTVNGNSNIEATLTSGQDAKLLTANGSCVIVSGQTQLQPQTQPPAPVPLPKVAPADAGPK